MDITWIFNILKKNVEDYYTLLNSFSNLDNSRSIKGMIWESFMFLLEQENGKSFKEGLTALEEIRVKI